MPFHLSPSLLRNLHFPDADHSGGKKEPLGMITSAQVVDLPDSMGDRIPESKKDDIIIQCLKGDKRDLF